MKSHGKSPWNSPVPLQKVMHLRKVGLQARPPGDVIFGDSDRCETYENENQTVEIMVTMVIIVHVAPSTNSVITVYTIYTRYTIYNIYIYYIYHIYTRYFCWHLGRFGGTCHSEGSMEQYGYCIVLNLGPHFKLYVAVNLDMDHFETN